MSRSADHVPPVLSLGLRPFFLAATLFGMGVVPVWWLVWNGRLAAGGPFHPVDWHVHEMVFGYAAAVIAGFLFTAVPNWTRRMPARGMPLLLLVLLWGLGRVAIAMPAPLPVVAVAAVDCAFLLAIVAMVAREIVAGRNWRNLMVVVPVALLAACNVLFHVEAALTGDAAHARRLSLAVVIFLVTLIGGRIVPSFTRNWLAQRGASRMPAPFGRFDGIALGLGAVALAAWTARPGAAASLLLGLAGAAHLLRLARWRGHATLRSPLLLMLHVAYGFVPLGLIAVAAAGAGWLPAAAGLHLLGIGGIGGMTMAVMIRATLGHTGRGLAAGPALTVSFALIAAAALVRAAAAVRELGPVDGTTAAATLWTLGFAIVSARLTPWLTGPPIGQKRPSQPPRRD